MTSTLFDSRREQFVGNDGLPLAGGRLWIGKPDQDPKLVPVTVYADRQLTTPIPPPIRLDEKGRTGSPVWVGESYSYVLEDVNGNQQVEEQRVEVVDVATVVEEIIGGLDAERGNPNLLVNGGMQVALRNTVSLTDAFQEGSVNLAWGRATNVIAGALMQGMDYGFSVSGYHALYSGVEMPSTNDVIEHQQRLFRQNAARLVARPCVISCLVQHNGPVSIPFYFEVSRANAPNDFSAVTVIQSSPATLVGQGESRRLTMVVENMGQCGDGVAVTLRAATGAVADFDLKVSEFQIQAGETLTPFSMREYREARAAVYIEGELLKTIDSRMQSFADGDPGYPRVQTDALATGAVTTSKITAGSVTEAKLGSSSVTAGKIASEAVTDGKLNTTATTAGRTWVLNRTALAVAGGVGTYVLAKKNGSFSGFNGFGDTESGSNLDVAGLTDGGAATVITGQTLSGTWRCMGHVQSGGGDADTRTTLWLRIS